MTRVWSAAVALAAALALSGLATTALALDPEERLDDPLLEERARALSQDLRCVVCDNQTIDDSDAQVAADMRREVREQLLAGQSDGEIRQWFVDRYGEWVLMTPRFSGATAIVWIAPAAALALGVWFFLARVRVAPAASTAQAAPSTPPQPARAAPLTAEEEAKLRALLADPADGSEPPTRS